MMNATRARTCQLQALKGRTRFYLGALALAMAVSILPAAATVVYADRVIIQDERDDALFMCLDLGGDLWFVTDDFDDFVYFSDELGSLRFKRESGKKKGSFQDQEDIDEDLDDEDIKGTIKGKFKINGKGTIILKDQTNGRKIKIRDKHVEREGGDCASRGHPDDHVSP